MGSDQLSKGLWIQDDRPISSGLLEALVPGNIRGSRVVGLILFLIKNSLFLIKNKLLHRALGIRV